MAVLLAATVLSATSLFAQSSKECDIDLLLLTSKNAGKLSQVEIGNFLSTFGNECPDDIEYSEWSNELLFTVLDKQTETMLIVLYKRERNLNVNIILGNLRSPIDDSIDVTSIIFKVEKTNSNNPMQSRVLEALRTAQKSSSP